MTKCRKPRNSGRQPEDSRQSVETVVTTAADNPVTAPPGDDYSRHLSIASDVDEDGYLVPRPDANYYF